MFQQKTPHHIPLCGNGSEVQYSPGKTGFDGINKAGLVFEGQLPGDVTPQATPLSVLLHCCVFVCNCRIFPAEGGMWGS